jgi:hypothetical protein
MASASMTISWQMLPVEAPQPDEDLGFGGGHPVRLIDNIVLKPLRLQVSVIHVTIKSKRYNMRENTPDKQKSFTVHSSQTVKICPIFGSAISSYSTVL